MVFHPAIKAMTPRLKSLLMPLAKLRRSWQVRLGISRLRRETATNPHPRIVVGSSNMAPPGWIPTEIDFLNLLRPTDWAGVFQKNSLSAILAEHVWEHLTPAEGATAAQICFEYLRPGGYLRIAVPDGYHPSADYQEWVRPGGCGPGADDHKTLHTCESLGQMLTKTGFQVTPLEYFDRSGQFHSVDWDPESGMIHRSRRFDARNADGKLRYTSLIVDATKPLAPPS